MTIQEQILKQIELEGRKNGLLNQIREKESEISELVSEIDKAEDSKNDAISDKERAKSNLQGTTNQVEIANEALEVAKKKLKDALANEARAEKECQLFSDEYFNEFDLKIKNLELAQNETEKRKEAMQAELKSLQSEIESLQSELKKQGYVLNMTEQARPKTSVL